MDYNALIETYIEKICPFCGKESCKLDKSSKKNIKIKGKSVISIKCSEYQLKSKASI